MLVKKINIIPELFIIKNSEFNFVSFSSSYSLCIKLKIPTNLVEIKSVQTFIWPFRGQNLPKKLLSNNCPSNKKKCMYTVLHIFRQVLFGAGNQSNHKNFDLSLLSYKCWLIFIGMKQKNFIYIFFKIKMADLKILRFFNYPHQFFSALFQN